MSLQKIRDELIEYGKSRGEKWNYSVNETGHFLVCLDTFTLDYMVGAIDYFLKKKKK